MRSGAAPYLTAPPQGPLVGQLVLPGEIPAPLLARPKGLGEGAGLPVVHAGEEVSAVPSPCLGKPRGRITGRQVLFPESGPGGRGGGPRSSAPPAPIPCALGKRLNFSGRNPSAGSGHLEAPRGRGARGWGAAQGPAGTGRTIGFQGSSAATRTKPRASPVLGGEGGGSPARPPPPATLAASSPVPLCSSRGRGRLRPREPRPAALPARGHSRFRGPGPRLGPSRAGTAPPGPPRPPPPPCGSRPRPGRPTRLPASAAAG